MEMQIGFERHMSLAEYKKQKIRMLVHEFCIALTKEQKEEINNLENEMKVDRYCHNIFMTQL